MTQAQVAVLTPTAVAIAPPDDFKMETPVVLAPVSSEQVEGTEHLTEDDKRAVDVRVKAFVAALAGHAVQSEEFRAKLDQAFSVGRKEIADATALSTKFTQGNFVGEANTSAYTAISDMRTLFDRLNPANQGDLFSATKFAGFDVSGLMGSRLSRYLRRFEGAESQISTLFEHLTDAKLVVDQDISALKQAETDLWNGVLTLQKVAYFIRETVRELSGMVESLKGSDSMRAKALETEVLLYVSQNLGDVLSVQALTLNAYTAVGQLKKTGREVSNGCDRMSTMGMAALRLAVMLARATGVQLRTMEMLDGAKKSVHDLISATGDALVTHTQKVAEFSANPLLGVQEMQAHFDQIQKAADIWEAHQATALQVLQANNAMMTSQIDGRMARIGAAQAATRAQEALTF